MDRNSQNQTNSKSFKTKWGFPHEFFIYKLVLWPCGLWPLQRQNIASTIRLLLATLTHVKIYCLITNCIHVIQGMYFLITDIHHNHDCRRNI